MPQPHELPGEKGVLVLGENTLRLARHVIPLILAACAAGPSELDKRNQSLLRQHNEIWDLMGLSPKAREELNGIVLDVNTRMDHNRAASPEAWAAASAVKRGQPKTREEYMAAHRKRFDALQIGESTQQELLAAADFTWTALQPGSDVPEEKRRTAQKIRDLMSALKGPPPCCDDNIFERAAKK